MRVGMCVYIHLLYPHHLSYNLVQMIYLINKLSANGMKWEQSFPNLLNQNQLEKLGWNTNVGLLHPRDSDSKSQKCVFFKTRTSSDLCGQTNFRDYWENLEKEQREQKEHWPGCLNICHCLFALGLATTFSPFISSSINSDVDWITFEVLSSSDSPHF